MLLFCPFASDAVLWLGGAYGLGVKPYDKKRFTVFVPVLLPQYFLHF